jgi:hypothetical protein
MKKGLVLWDYRQVILLYELPDDRMTNHGSPGLIADHGYFL